MGRGGRRMGTTATGIYLVEPKYFDEHKKKVTTSGKRKRGKASESCNQKQKKSKPNQPKADNGSDDESGFDDEDEREENNSGNANDTMETGDHEGGSLPTNTSQVSILNPTHAVTHLVACPVIPPLAGLNDAEYEFAVMDVYINAKSRSICRRRVSNEYFGNDKGMSFNSTH
jgi:hypothetical protein